LTLVAYEHVGHEVRLDRLEPAEGVHQQILEERQEMEQAEHYHGLYDDRFIKPGKLKETRQRIDEARAAGSLELDDLRSKVAEHTGERLAELMARRTDLEQRAATFAAIEDAQLEPDEDPFDMDGELIRRGDVASLLGEARQAHDETDKQLHRIDRASFRYHYAACADPAQRKDLSRRYRFLVKVQRHVKELNGVENRTAPIMQGLTSGAQLSEEDVDYVVSTFSQGRSSLATAVEACEGMPMPQLAHLGSYDSVRAYVLPEPVVEPLQEPRRPVEATGGHRSRAVRLQRSGRRHRAPERFGRLTGSGPPIERAVTFQAAGSVRFQGEDGSLQWDEQ